MITPVNADGLRCLSSRTSGNYPVGKETEGKGVNAKNMGRWCGTFVAAGGALGIPRHHITSWTRVNGGKGREVARCMNDRNISINFGIQKVS